MRRMNKFGFASLVLLALSACENSSQSEAPVLPGKAPKMAESNPETPPAAESPMVERLARPNAEVRLRKKEVKRVGISGTFLQYQSWMKDLTPAQWRKELHAMRQAGVDTIVLQWMQNDDNRFFSYHPWDDKGLYSWDQDVTEQILHYADRHGMKVYIGLAFNNGWWTKWNDRPFLAETKNNNIAFMGYLWLRYAHHRSMRGWYIPYEIMDSDYGPEAMDNLRDLLSSLSRVGDKLFTGREMKVAFSVFFQAHFSPERTAEIFTNLLTGSDIDILMVQDGVGANDWQNELQPGGKVESYLKAFQRAGANAKIPVWTILESFQKKVPGGPAEFKTASLEQLRNQLDLEGPISTKIVTFDFFHYLSPLRGPSQKVLYEELYPLARPYRAR